MEKNYFLEASSIILAKLRRVGPEGSTLEDIRSFIRSNVDHRSTISNISIQEIHEIIQELKEIHGYIIKPGKREKTYCLILTKDVSISGTNIRLTLCGNKIEAKII